MQYVNNFRFSEKNARFFYIFLKNKLHLREFKRKTQFIEYGKEKERST